MLDRIKIRSGDTIKDKFNLAFLNLMRLDHEEYGSGLVIEDAFREDCCESYSGKHDDILFRKIISAQLHYLEGIICLIDYKTLKTSNANKQIVRDKLKRIIGLIYKGDQNEKTD